MLRHFFKSSKANATITRTVYSQIVAQARRSAFYSDFGVPDTLDGRFNMIVLHNFLLFNRLQIPDSATSALSQEVFDLFRLDMDRSLRELGVGDTTVPKRMKTMMQVFYGRADAYGSALRGSDPQAALANAVSRNILSYNDTLFDEGPAAPLSEAEAEAHAAQLAAYVLGSVERLQQQSESDILAGSLFFADPTDYI